MGHLIRTSLILALLTALLPVAAASMIEPGSTCRMDIGDISIEIGEIPRERENEFDQNKIIEAEWLDEAGRQAVIWIHPMELELTYFSEETVDFLFQRECARLKLGQIGKTELSDNQYLDADCEAIWVLESPRDLEVIERDLQLSKEERFWQSTMGPSTRLLDLDCGR